MRHPRNARRVVFNGNVARELAHAARIHARGVPSGIVLLDQDRPQAAQGQMQRRRAAMDAAADDHDVGGAHRQRSTALRSASAIGSEASSARVIGFTGESGGKLAPLADICFRMPSSETPRIQEGHELIGHMLCALVEAEMYPRDAG